MHSTMLIACLWPGLPQLWWRGNLRSLMLALLFAVALNFSLAATFVWPEMVSSTMRSAAWGGLSLFWSVAVWISYRDIARMSCGMTAMQQQGLFEMAQTEYLKGHWLEAETLLKKMIATDEQDGDARLMLASLLRHTKRADEALVELDALELSEAGRKWTAEISRERQLDRAALVNSDADGN